MNEVIFYFFDDDLDFLDLLIEEVSFNLKMRNIIYKIVKNPIINEISSLIQNQVFFLDIEMPEINGLDLGKIIRHRIPNCTIIYISSYDKYVFDSFESKPFDFIQKDKYKSYLHRVLDRYFEEKMNEFIFKYDNIQIKLKYCDILYIRKYTNNIEFVTSKQVYKYRTSLNHVINKLNSNRKIFIRIHKSLIVNLKKIQKFDKNIIYIYNGEKLVVSRKYLFDFKTLYYSDYSE